MRRLYQLIQKNILFDKISELFTKQPAKINLPLITISRERGSGGKLIAYLVAKKLGRQWKVYHKEIIDEMAKSAKFNKKLIEEVDEKNIPFIDKIINDFFGKKYISLSLYQKHLVKVLSTISQRGYALIIGRGAEYLLPDALKIRIICQMNQRIRWMMQYENLSEKEAVKEIRESDEQRLNFIKSLYQHDPRKAHHYDLVIRTGPNLSIEDAADLIVRLAKRRFKI